MSKKTVIRDQHFGIARKIVSNMTAESWETIPHAVISYEPEVTEFLKVMKDINKDATPETKLTINTIMLRVIVEGLKACPIMNSHIEFNRKLVRGNVKTFKEIDISMPMVLKTGEMMTINMHDMHDKTMSQMRDTIADSVRRANNSDMNEVMFEVSLDNTLQGLKRGKIAQTINRLVGSKTGKHKVKTLTGKAKKEYYSIPVTDRLTKHDIEQGTITVSNLGSVCRNWNGICTLLEIIPPQVCAIAIGATQLVPIAEQDGTIRTGYRLPFTIAFDHRALDMGDITPFVNKLNEIFENPDIIREWV
ncbi:MAG TPA: 2-oxo acid dehydrogenase subunit E2 [Candidatus Eubacterium faecigallinarum]|nr:2-oxo acid dehydrogenase subunit E2 [Candidatus Eubacterium faecigallinarum]